MTFMGGIVLCDLAADIQPIDVRQVHVHHDHRPAEAACSLGDLGAVGDFGHPSDSGDCTRTRALMTPG